ncbi:hypothetical protein [Streptomyces diacarni]|nr:hypothetical protein [Streptomyces diacarni]
MPECDTCRQLQVMKDSAKEEFDMSKYTDAVVLLKRHLDESHQALAKAGR